jgi:hypothetical protein
VRTPRRGACGGHPRPSLTSCLCSAGDRSVEGRLGADGGRRNLETAIETVAKELALRPPLEEDDAHSMSSFYRGG